MKACVECKWMDSNGYSCSAPQNIRTYDKVDLVTGKREVIDYKLYQRCYSLREGGVFHAFLSEKCGESGRWWQPKSKTNDQ